MELKNLNSSLETLYTELIEKCTRVRKLPNLESQAQKAENDITYAIKLLTECNNELDHIIYLNQINSLSHEGMKKLEYIFKNILDQKNQDHIKRLNELLDELKKLYKMPAKTTEEIQKKLTSIEAIINQIEDFQNELSCKTLYKKNNN